MEVLLLDGESLTTANLSKLQYGKIKIGLAPEAKASIQASRDVIDHILTTDEVKT